MRLSIGSFVCSVIGTFRHYNAEYTDGSSFLLLSISRNRSYFQDVKRWIRVPADFLSRFIEWRHALGAATTRAGQYHYLDVGQ